MKWLRVLVFVLVVLSLWGGLHLYLYSRLRKFLPLGAKAQIWLALALFLLFISYPVVKLTEGVVPYPLALSLSLLASLWMGLAFYLFFYFIAGDIFLLILPGKSPHARVAIGWAALILALLTVIYGLFESFRVRTVRLEIEMKGLERPYKIAFLSDLHLGLNLNFLKFKKTVPVINSFSPDIILIGGDLLDRDAKENHQARLFKGLKTKYGIFGVTGNHEYYAGERKALAFVRAAGVRLIRNRVIKIGDLQIAGIDDEEFLGSRWKEKLEEILKTAEAEKPLILLKHRPTGFEIARSLGVDLMLCGHTHRAQLFPLHLITSAVYRYYYGYHRENGLRIYVTSGLGTWGPPLRLLATPEIVLITLVPRY